MIVSPCVVHPPQYRDHVVHAAASVDEAVSVRVQRLFVSLLANACLATLVVVGVIRLATLRRR